METVNGRMTCEAMQAEFEQLKTDKAPIVQVWDDIETFVMPLTGRNAEVQANGGAPDAQQTDQDVWDLSAVLANEHLASSLHGGVTNPSSRWIEFEWEAPELEKDHDSIEHREELTNVMWSALQTSDFNMEIASGYLEFSGIGNMFLMLEPGGDGVEWEGFDFTCIPSRQAFVVEDSKGGIKRFYRALKWTPVQVVDHAASKERPGVVSHCPDAVKQKAQTPAGATEKLDVVFAIVRREGVKLDPYTKENTPVPEERRAFAGVYFLAATGEQVGVDSGYHEMPVVHARWGRKPGSVWGFGRGHVALRNVKFLNRYKELARAQAALAVDPPTMSSERGLQTKKQMQPGGHMYGDPKDFQVLESHSRFDVSAEVLRDERQEIRRCFHEDDLQLKESPAMTATEVQARRDLMDRVLGSPVGRLYVALSALVGIGLRMMYRANQLPEPPTLVKQLKAEVKIKFRGPIARAQVMDEVVGIERQASFVANLLKMGFEDARAYYDLGAALEEHGKRIGAPARTLRSAQDAKRILDEQARQAKAMAMAKAAKDAGAGAASAANAAATAASAGMPDPTAGGGAFPMAPQPGLVPSGGVTP